MNWFVIVILVIAVAAGMHFLFRKEMVCKDCGFTGFLNKKNQGSELIGLLLLLLGIIPGLIYIIWNISNRTYKCPKCSGQHLIPADTPVGRQLIGVESRVETSLKTPLNLSSSSRDAQIGQTIEEDDVETLVDKLWPLGSVAIFALAMIGILFFAVLVRSAFSSGDAESKTKTVASNETSISSPKTKPTKGKKRRSASKQTEECRVDIASESFKVVKKLDDSRYWLENVSNRSGSGHVEMETRRSLSIGKGVIFQEATFLGTNGDYSNLVVYWREGCSAKGKAAADYTQGTWWTPIDPNDPTGEPCVKAVTDNYNIAPATLVQTSNGGCVVNRESSTFDLLFLDCTNSVPETQLVYTRTRKQCLNFVSMTSAYSDQISSAD